MIFVSNNELSNSHDTHHIHHFKSGPLEMDSRTLSSPQYSLPVSSSKHSKSAQTQRSDVDAEAIMAPIMQPLMRLFDYYSRNKQTLEYAERAEKQRKSSIFDPDSLMQAINYQPPEQHQQQQPSIMEKLFEPNSNSPVNDALVPTMFNSDDSKGPLSTLLESIGMNARPHDEVQVGRDKTISILGMPVGRRDGIALSPLTGVSYGNQDMFGPIAVNDKYNVKWDFLDKIGAIFVPNG
uniref:Uncharacterized protein n=1 Tax=Ditylenchus dipsaci TaxID=166011 RepID=A0A915E5I0_9BILA